MADIKGPGISLVKDGPYRVSADIPLNQAVIVSDKEGIAVRWEQGPHYPGNGKDYLLCRCGRSARKPYCDGAHVKAGFTDRFPIARQPYQQAARLLAGPGLNLLDAEQLCAGARFCDRDGEIWNRLGDTNQEEGRRLVLEEACACPAGRLTAVTLDGQPLEPVLPKEISLVQDPANEMRGPLWIKGGIPLGGEGGPYETRNRVTLCRCGESANMPFCDASHYDCAHMLGLDDAVEEKPG